MRGASLLFLLIAAAALALGLAPPRAQPGGEAPRTVVDMNGRHVALPAVPAHVVVLTPRLADYLTIDGGSGHVAGASRIALQAIRGSELEAIHPQALGIPVLAAGVHPDDPEILLRARPDAVLAWLDTARLLDALGVPGVISLKGDPNDPLGIARQAWTLLGAVSGRPGRATGLLAQWEARRLALRAQLAGLPPGPRIVVLYPGQGVGQIGGRYNHLNGAIHAVGASDPADDRTITADGSLEQLLELDPDLILLTPGYPRPPAALYADPQWRPLRAARDRRIYAVPALADAGGPVDEPLFVRWLAELIAGDRLPADWRAMARATYLDVYGRAPPDAAIDAMLRLHDNLASCGYRRFAPAPPPGQAQEAYPDD